jgi:hypothetical protein
LNNRGDERRATVRQLESVQSAQHCRIADRIAARRDAPETHSGKTPETGVVNGVMLFRATPTRAGGQGKTTSLALSGGRPAETQAH